MNNRNDITISDVLNLPIMANAKLVAGKGGLGNSIQYVNVLDNLFNDTNTSEFLPKYGNSFYLTSLYYGTKNPEYIMQVLEHFVDVNAAAVCIIDEYLSKLPDKAYAYADRHDLPIIFIDKETPYAIIISGIMELKLSYQEIQRDREILIALSSQKCSEDQVRSLVYQLNPNFASNIIVLHCLSKADAKDVSATSNKIKLLDNVRRFPMSFASEYKNGVLLIHSFNFSDKSRVEEMTGSIVEKVINLLSSTIIGISRVHSILDISQAISEALTASNSGSLTNSGTIGFEDLGVARLISSLNGNSELDTYYDSLYGPIRQYDEKNNSNLMETILSFVENNMDYVKTSKSMFIHENTIRYRLNKVKSLIPYGNSDMDFHNTLYIFQKIYKMKSIN